MDIKIEKGKPQNYLDRIPGEMKCYDLLDSIKVGYTRADHEAAFTMEICEGISDKLETHICKNLFLCNRQKTMFYLLLMPADKKFKTKDLSSQINSARLSFADEQQLKMLLDLTPGSVTVLGLINDTKNKVKLLIDKDLLDKHDSIGVHPCINTSTLKIQISDLTEKLVPALHHTPQIVDLPL